MRLRPDDLQSHLSESMSPVYYVTGDELLLVDESCRDIRQAAEKHGFSEYTSVTMDASTGWPAVRSATEETSLFGDRQFVLARVAKSGVGREGSEFLCDYVSSPNEDVVLLVRNSFYEWRDKNSKWFKELDRAAVVVVAETLSANAIPRWLNRRAEQLKLQLSDEALQLMADRSEGNLFAAQQEMEKLRLIVGDTSAKIDSDDVSLMDVSAGDVFGLCDAVIRGDAKRIGKLAAVLQAEGTHVLPILGAISAHLRRAEASSLNASVRASPNQKRQADTLAKRHGSAGIATLLTECAHIDSQSKGGMRGSDWDSLERLLLAVAGLSASHLERDYAWARIDYSTPE